MDLSSTAVAGADVVLILPDPGMDVIAAGQC